jgi:hypothetical protein
VLSLHQFVNDIEICSQFAQLQALLTDQDFFYASEVAASSIDLFKLFLDLLFKLSTFFLNTF